MASIISNIKKIPRKLPVVRNFYNTEVYKDYVRRTKARKMIAVFLGDNVAPARKRALVSDMMRMFKEHKFMFDEYFLFNFEGMPDEKRFEFVSDIEHLPFCERMNRKENQIIFDDKTKTFEYFGKYYKREILPVTRKNENEFREFLNKHTRIIVKPFDKCCGQGVKIVDSSSANIEILSAKLLEDYPEGFLAEEVIMQCSEIASLHPSSVNTVRVPTIYYSDDDVEVIHPFFRVGRGDSIVDNAGAGGIICCVDVPTGKIVACADEMGKTYTVHPETGHQLIGYTIPRWDEAVALAKELAKTIEGNHYAGWDLALTDDGWVMVEGNARGQYLWQIPTQVGFREELDGIMEKLGLKSVMKNA